MAAITLVDMLTGPHVSLLAVFGAVVIWVGRHSSRTAAIGVAALAAGGGAWAAAIDPEETASFVVIVTNGVLRGMLLAILGIGTVLLHHTVAELSNAARRDPLTQLFNRAAIFELIAYEQLRAQRSGRPLSIAYCDLDGLKAMNDRAGHDAGDLLITRFAQSLTEGLRTTDAVARLGGDEFVALLPETASEEAVAALSRILDDEETPQASCGLVTWAAPVDLPTVLVAMADRTMYEAKSTGGGLRTAIVDRPGGDAAIRRTTP